MTAISQSKTTETAISQLIAVLTEAMEGPKNKWSYFTDHSVDAAVLGAIRSLTAEQASVPCGGSSIAAHVHHLNFSLAASKEWLEGDISPKNWEESWSVTNVNEAGWIELQIQLQQAYQALKTSIAHNAANSIELMGGAIGAVAHVAYHLGAIRQKLAVIRCLK